MIFNPNKKYTYSMASYRIDLPHIKNTYINQLQISLARNSRLVQTTSDTEDFVRMEPEGYSTNLYLNNELLIPVSLFKSGEYYDKLIISNNNVISERAWNKVGIEAHTSIQFISNGCVITFHPKIVRIIPLFQIKGCSITISSYKVIISGSIPWSTTDELIAYMKNKQFQFMIYDLSNKIREILPMEIDCTKILNICDYLSYQNDGIKIKAKQTINGTEGSNPLNIKLSISNSSYFNTNPKSSITYINCNQKQQINLHGKVDEMDVNGYGHEIINKKQGG